MVFHRVSSNGLLFSPVTFQGAHPQDSKFPTLPLTAARLFDWGYWSQASFCAPKDTKRVPREALKRSDAGKSTVVRAGFKTRDGGKLSIGKLF
jgi:hypothetical protein